ncbi:hypothetical protein [Methylorubrum thiocyanatum]|uniref:hypothetical protein n=1 Tax=Methylorubrum thiocyanatum TaxID=47958 RepID=UPI0036462C84
MGASSINFTRPTAAVRLNSVARQDARRQDQRCFCPGLRLHAHREMRLDVRVLLSGAGKKHLGEQALLRRRGIGDSLEQAVEASNVGHPARE